MSATAVLKCRAAYVLAGGWHLRRGSEGFVLLAPITNGRLESCGLLRHHLDSFVQTFDAEPAEEMNLSIGSDVDDGAVPDPDFGELPICYGFARGWKLLKAEQHFKLAPPHNLFALPAGIITHCIAQFAGAMGGEPLVHEDASATRNQRASAGAAVNPRQRSWS